MGMELVVSSEFGLVALVVVATSIASVYMMSGIRAARLKYGVVYPNLYAVESENKNAKEFNCVQRGHQNFLEIVPFFLATLLMAGLQHPRIATLAGFVFLAARVIYFRGYSTGEPKKRLKGAAVGYFSMMLLMACSVSFTVHQIFL